MKLDFDTHLPLPSKLLSKGALYWGRSKVGAPLAPTPEMEAEAQANMHLELDQPAPLAPHSLAEDCRALSLLIPRGMALRALGSQPGDRQALFVHWTSLDPEALRTRFFYNPSHALLRKRAYDLDGHNPRFAGIFAEDGRLACVAEWAFDSPTEAEAAFSTLPEFRRRGLAKIAAAACALDARAHGVSTLRIDTLRENSAAQALAASLGGARAAGSPEGMADCVSSLIDLSADGPRSIESRIGLKFLAETAASLQRGTRPPAAPTAGLPEDATAAAPWDKSENASNA